jgi:peptidoglycan/xylan/chitin deacetylase (PgdA/CDA1 family)
MMKRRLKMIIGAAARISGMGVRKTFGASGVPGTLVLTFHRVVPTPYFRPGMTLGSQAFRMLLEFLAKEADVVDLAAPMEPTRKTGHRIRVALTFDDGYRDNYQYAFPILKEFGFPATIFLATGLLDDPTRRLWWDRLADALVSWDRMTDQMKVSVIAVMAEKGLSVQGVVSPIALINRAVDHLRVQPAASRDPFIDQVVGITSEVTQAPERLMLSWDEVREMTAGGVTFGGHTINHANMAEVSRGDLELEVAGCKRRIEEETDRVVRSFAYPYGWYSDEAVGIVQDNGFEVAVTTNRGVYHPGWNPYLIPRISVADDVLRGVDSAFSQDMWHYELLRTPG